MDHHFPRTTIAIVRPRSGVALTGMPQPTPEKVIA